MSVFERFGLSKTRIIGIILLILIIGGNAILAPILIADDVSGVGIIDDLLLLNAPILLPIAIGMIITG